MDSLAPDGGENVNAVDIFVYIMYFVCSVKEFSSIRGEFNGELS